MKTVKFIKTDEEKLVTDTQARLYLEMRIIETEQEIETENTDNDENTQEDRG